MFLRIRRLVQGPPPGLDTPAIRLRCLQWQIEHTALLTETRDRFLASGYHVFTETQNAFRLQGKTAVLAGRPGLIIVNGDDVLIIDVKTGQERPSHAAQLMIYMYALPRVLQQYRDARIRGEVFYPTRTHLVGRGSLDQGFIRRLNPNPPKG